MLSITTGWAAARRVFDDPASSYQQRAWADVQSAYSLLWAYYNNSIFDRTAAYGAGGASSLWSAYKGNYTLYRNIRSIYNPTRRLVDFYAGSVYPGVLPAPGQELPDFVQEAIPLGDDIPDQLREAIRQVWQWSNWQANKSVMVRYGAALGSVLVEVTDDLARGKVNTEVIWPGYVAEMVTDPAGNVKRYALEYLSYDEEEHRGYTYRKEVDGSSFRYYRDNQPYDYGAGTVVPNLYGFVPAVWCKHTSTGSDLGSPAVAGSLGKIDELNNLVAHAHDQIHKVIGAPQVLWTAGSLRNLFAQPKRGASDEAVSPSEETESVLLLQGPAGGSSSSLVGNLPLADTMLFVDKLMGELEADHPELAFYRELRSMSQLTGPAAARLVGDVASRLAEASANYDQQSIKLFQMAVAIGGMRASAGGWGTLSRQQEKFAGFSLDSYRAGDLDFVIEPRPLLVPTRQEQALEKQAIWTGVGLAVSAGVPLPIVLEDEGWTQEQLARLEEAKAQEPIPQVQAQAQAQAQPVQVTETASPMMRALVAPGGE